MTSKWKKSYKSFFNKDGWWMTNNIPFGGKLSPKLKPSEWLYWVLLNTENADKETISLVVGSRTTVWRIRKILKEKGYL